MPPTPAHSVERLRQDAQLKVVSSPEVPDRSARLSEMEGFSEALLSGKLLPDQFGTQGDIATDVRHLYVRMLYILTW